ncbi:MAG: hypothetical protein KJO91_07080 [Gammaproteobacteria bacterium]|nr:hypothetical protein [Gammaproteobacteria bacterium]
MSKKNILKKLEALRSIPEVDSGFSEKRSCLSWAAKVAPLLSFNRQYSTQFSVSLSMLQSGFSPENHMHELITTLEMGIEQLKHELESEAPIEPIKLSSPLGDYVHQDRIKELTTISSSDFDLTKLIKFCNELNDSRANDNVFSIIMLCRAIIDHVPPVFGVNNFNEVANNYSGTSSFKKSMGHLNISSRNIADQHLHTHIRNSETLPTLTQVDFSNDLDVLLSEIVRLLNE